MFPNREETGSPGAARLLRENTRVDARRRGPASVPRAFFLRSSTEGDRGGDSRAIAHHARGVAVARQVFGKVDMARTVAMHGPIAEADFDFARYRDHELAARSRMPINEVARRIRAKLNAFSFLECPELRVRFQRHQLDVRLPV